METTLGASVGVQLGIYELDGARNWRRVEDGIKLLVQVMVGLVVA